MSRTIRNVGLLACTVLLLPGLAFSQAAPPASFHNPLLPSGADPSVVERNGIYYYMQTAGTNLTIWKTRDLTDLKHAEKKVVWTAPATGPYSKDVWAPELHFVKNKWYIYFCADAGSNESHRLWVLENSAADPLTGTWTMKGKLADAADRWAIDPTEFSVGPSDYVLWSGWRGDSNGTQSLFIARLKDPWTIEGPSTVLSSPQFPWEKVGDLDTGAKGPIAVPHVDVNEGPEVLRHGDRLFLVYSASGCWTNYYELGMLTAAVGSNLLDAASWTKLAQPVFWESAEAGVFAPGHNTFFKSPDGTQDWILYHANSAAGQGCGQLRSPRAQRFSWRPDGTPDFGRPLPTSQPIPKPSGTP